MDEKYALALSETLSIINSATEAERSKIPKSFMEFLIKNSNPNYNPKFDPNIAIKDLNLRKETKGLLSLIYISYLSNEQQKYEYNTILNENYKKYEQKLREEYDVCKVFEERKNRNINIGEDDKIDKFNTNMIQYKKNTIFRKIINKIISFFRRR